MSAFSVPPCSSSEVSGKLLPFTQGSMWRTLRYASPTFWSRWHATMTLISMRSAPWRSSSSACQRSMSRWCSPLRLSSISGSSRSRTSLGISWRSRIASTHQKQSRLLGSSSTPPSNGGPSTSRRRRRCPGRPRNKVINVDVRMASIRARPRATIMVV